MSILGKINPVSKTGKPRFRSEKEFETKLCTKCDDYWPCDPEFFRRNAGHWSPWCRACEAEAIRTSRRRKAARTIAACLALAIALPSRASHCDDIAALAYAVQSTKLDGFSRAEVLAVTSGSSDTVLAHAAAPVVAMSYDGNADDALSPGKFARLVRSVCRSTEPNALNWEKP